MLRYFTLILAFKATLLLAHPHIFIELFPKVTVQDGFIKKLTVLWRFDSMSSMYLIMDNDKNRDNQLDEQEVKAMEPSFHQKLGHFEYFTQIYVKNNKGEERKITMPKPQDFKASIDKDQVLHQFSFYFNDQLIKAKEAIMSFNDETFFVAFHTEKGYISISDPKIRFKLSQQETMIGYDLVLE